MEIQAIGLVANLDGTGGDPPQSGFRQMLVTEMQKRGVDSPGKILASPSTALALARAELPPGIQKGDRFDVEVYVPQEHGEVTSLRDGIMYEVRLAERFALGEADRALLAIDEALALSPWEEYYREQRRRFMGARDADDRPSPPIRIPVWQFIWEPAAPVQAPPQPAPGEQGVIRF